MTAVPTAPAPTPPVPGPSWVWSAVRRVADRRARSELLYCLITIPLSAVSFVVAVVLVVPGVALSLSVVGALAGLALLTVATRAGRGLGGAFCGLAARWAGAQVALPRPFQPGRGVLGRVDARLRDAAGWRGAGYLLLRLPLALLSVYAVALTWLSGLFDLTYPLWWVIAGGSDHGVHPSPVTTGLPVGDLHVGSWPVAFAICVLGAGQLLAAPWAVRLVVSMDQWLIRRLLGGTPMADRVRELEAGRAQAVDDSAALLRRVERDLHDGAQARLVALAMSLGMAKEKLGEDGEPVNVTRARELVDTAHRSAKEALTELRDLARGIHPPALDGGLPDALATLTARSAVPASLTADIAERPTAAIETIAYFCAAELLANVAKHSGASRATVRAQERDGNLQLTVTDNGVGGADPGRGSGLAGLGLRIRTVDGTLDIRSPAGGPTVITVGLPLSA
ncbi:MAG: sensor domain-containing protein [Actinomycetota bacterium]